MVTVAQRLTILTRITTTFFLTVFLLVILCCPRVHALSIGSLLAVSQESFQTFPAASSTNSISGFAWMKDGFKLEDNTTSCTFSALFPVAGAVDLNAGTLHLGADLVFENVTSLEQLGSIYGQSHRFGLCATTTYLNFVPGVSILKDVSIDLDANTILRGHIKVKGDCSINGFGSALTLMNTCTVMLDAGASLKLRNVVLHGMRDSSIRCLNNSGSVELDNVLWNQTGNYTFSLGSLRVKNTVDFVGTTTFLYTSPMTSTIDVRSQWGMQGGMVLVMGRKQVANSRQPLYLASPCSVLQFKNSTLSVTGSGMQFVQGKIVCANDTTIEINSTSTSNGLILGDGANAKLVFQINPGTAVIFTKGHLVYNIPSKTSIKSKSRTSKIVRNASSVFYVQQDITLSDITTDVASGATLTVVSGKTMDYTNCSIVNPAYEFLISGDRYNFYTNRLTGNDSVFLFSGVLPAWTQVAGTGNKIHGTGSITGPVIVENNASDVTFDLTGDVLGNITLNGGKLIVGSDLLLARSVSILSTGTVDLASNKLQLGSKDTSWTSSLYWSGSNGSIDFNAKVSLSGVWTFSGTCRINGNGNTLDLNNTGKLVVERGSTVIISDLRFEDISGTQLRCLDDAGTVVLQNVSWIQDGDFTFDTGKIELKNSVDFRGTYTFFYKSGQSSIVHEKSEWYFRGGMTLSIGRKAASGGNEPLIFTNDSSILQLANATWSITGSGMKMATGTIVCKNDVTIEINSTNTTNGLVLGDGVRTDMIFEFNPGASVIFSKGHLTYNVPSPDAIKSKSTSSTIIRRAKSVYYVQQDLTLTDIGTDVSPLATLSVASGKTLAYKNCKINDDNYKFELSGTRYNSYTNLLKGNDSLFLTKGIIPAYTLVQNTGNVIKGVGGISGGITLADSSADLTFNFQGLLANNVTMNSGKVILGDDLKLDQASVLVGPGTVKLNASCLHVGAKPTTWTGGLFWDCNNGQMELNAKTTLSSTWTFSGTATLRGNRQTLVLAPGGMIVIERGSKLTLNNIIIEGVSGTNIRCLNDSSSIVLDYAKWTLAGNYTFTYGSLDIDSKFDVFGSYTFKLNTKVATAIESDAYWRINEGARLSYAPRSASRNLISMADGTAKLVLDGATLHATTTGLTLTKGTLEVRGLSTLVSDARIKAEGIYFGDGASAANDCDIDIHPESRLKLLTGYAVARNVE